MEYSWIYMAILLVSGLIGIGLYIMSIGSRLITFEINYINNVKNEIIRNLFIIIIFGGYILTVLMFIGLLLYGLSYLAGVFE